MNGVGTVRYVAQGAEVVAQENIDCLDNRRASCFPDLGRFNSSRSLPGRSFHLLVAPLRTILEQ